MYETCVAFTKCRWPPPLKEHRLTGLPTSVTSRTTMPEPPLRVTSPSLAPEGILEAHVTVTFGGGVSPLRTGLGNAKGDEAGECAAGLGLVPEDVLPQAASMTGTTISASHFVNARVCAISLRLIATGQRDAVCCRLPTDKALSRGLFVRVQHADGDTAGLSLDSRLALGVTTPRRPYEARPLLEVRDHLGQGRQLEGVRVQEGLRPGVQRGLKCTELVL